MKIISITVCLCMMSILISCGSPQTKSDKYYAEYKKRAEYKREYESQLQRREAAGEKLPLAIEDPGHVIVDCLNLKEEIKKSRGLVIIPAVGLGVGDFICGNTIDGKLLLQQRKWRCGELANNECVCGNWRNGLPKFNDPFGNLAEGGIFTIDMRRHRGEIYKLSRCTIPQSFAIPQKIKHSPTTSEIIDLMINPEFLLDAAFSRDSVSVEGIKLGDSEDLIPREQIEKQKTESDWRHLKSGARFRLKDGIVVEMGIPQSRTKSFHVNSEADVSRVFGAPDKVEAITAGSIVLVKQYHYVSKGLLVHWAKRLGGLAHITVFSAEVCAGFYCR